MKSGLSAVARGARPAFARWASARQPSLASRAKAGGAKRDRTADLLHAMQALSQLSYGPNLCLSGLGTGDEF